MGSGWMRRLGVMVPAMALLTGCGAVREEGEDAVAQLEQGVSASFAAVADAHVAAESPTTNFGSAGTLLADLSPLSVSLLRFNVTALSGTVTRATLRLYVTDGSADGPELFLATGGWSESTVSWNSRPAQLSTRFGETGAVSSGTWMEFDVTLAVQGNGEVNFMLTPSSSDGTAVASRQAATTAQRPQLVVTTEAATPSPPPSPGCGEIITQQLGIPRGDATLARDQPTTDLGSLDSLVADFSPLSEVWMGFEVPERAPDDTVSTIVKATLRLYAYDGSTDGPALYDSVYHDPFGVTWASAYPGPRTYAPIDNKGGIAANTWVEYDVTKRVAFPGSDGGGHFVGFALASGTDDATRFYSSEASNAALRPQLVITRSTGCTYRGSGGALTGERQHGGAGYEFATDLATDRQGGLVVVGAGLPGYTFGGSASAAESDFVLARYDTTGAHLWTRSYGVSGESSSIRPAALTITPEGMLLVVGAYRGAPDLGLGALPLADTFHSGMFIAKFAPDGRPMWSRGFLAHTQLASGPEPRTLGALDVATDANGSLIVVAALYGTTDLGGGELQGGREDGPSTAGLLLAKFRWDGVHLWSTSVPPGSCVEGVVGRSLATDSAGNVLVGGHTCETAALGGSGPHTPFVARYTSAGVRQWVRRLDGATGEVSSVAVGTGDAVHFAGSFKGRFTFAGHTAASIESEPVEDLMVGTYRADGSEAWLRDSPGGLGEGAASELAVDGAGRLAVIGRQSGVDFGGGVLARGFFVARYSAAGSHLWSRSFTGWPQTGNVAVQPSGNVVLNLNLWDSVLSVGRTYSSRGNADVLLLQYAP